MSVECRCSRITREGRSFCETCQERLENALAEVPWTVEQLEVTRSGEKAANSTGTMSASAEKPLPINLAALEAHQTLRAVLVSWVRFCDDEQVRGGRPGLPADDLNAMSRWLLHRVEGLSLLEIGAEAPDEVEDAIATARRLIDRPADRLYLGECGECQTLLWGRVGKAKVQCPRCATVHDAGELRAKVNQAMTERSEGLMLTATEAATLLCAQGLADDAMALADRIRKWAKPTKTGRDTERPPKLVARGHVRREGQRPRPTYSVDEVRALVDSMHENRQKRKGRAA